MRVLGLILALAASAAGVFGAPAQATRTVSGRVVPAEGGTAGVAVPGLNAAPPARGVWMRLAAAAGEAANDPIVSIQADGSFEFLGVAPGPYQLIVLPKISIAPVSIIVMDRDVLGVAVGVPRYRVSGSVAVDGGGVAPRFLLTFINRANLLDRYQTPVAGGFTVEIPAGEYRVEPSDLPSGYFAKSIMSGGTLLENDALRVESNGAPPIAITLAVSSPPPWVRVRGRVEGSGPASGKVTSVTISGTPMADTLRATVNSDGSFEFPRVLPGRYEARTLPSSVHFSRPIVIEGADTSDVTIAAPNSRDFAGEFVRIPPGEFMMGCSAGDTTCIVNESPAHRVAITRPFEIGKYEVTQAQWEAVMGANPSRFRGADRPVENVNRWEDAEEFIARLNAFNDGYRYRLPTEAEWEYAARAGSTGPFQGASAPADVAWFNQNSGMETHPVGQKPPNAWGLHDMLGNVSEWVADWYDPVYYATSPTLDPQGPPTGNMRVFRGGSSGVPPIETRVSDRRNRPYQGNNLSVYGFRIVREQVP